MTESSLTWPCPLPDEGQVWDRRCLRGLLLCAVPSPDCFPPRFLLRVDFLTRGWSQPCRGRREGCSEYGTSTGTMRLGPAEGGRRGARRRGAGTSLVKAAKACCSEARRPASDGPPLASPQPCSSSPFAPVGARHGKAPPPHTARGSKLRHRVYGGREGRAAAARGRGAATSGAAWLPAP